MLVIVCGGRNYADYDRLRSGLFTFEREQGCTLEVIQGGANGADSLAKRWALENGRQYREIPAYWSKYGRGAGPRRNGEMLKLKPAYVLAFPGGRGTANMIEQAKRGGVLVREFL